MLTGTQGAERAMTADEMLDWLQQERLRLERQLTNLQAKRGKALAQGDQSAITALDADIALAKRALDENRRYQAHHPDA
jgi:hypothetical protein